MYSVGILSSSSSKGVMRENWITPEEQLERLVSGAVRENIDTMRESLPEEEGGLPESLDDRVVECVSRSILRQSILLPLVDEQSYPPLFELACEQVVQLPFDSSILTNWYVARMKLQQLPEKLPPLPEDIHEILTSRCPIWGAKKKPNGEHYTVGDTHALQLLCEEDGTLEQFEKVLKQYNQDLHLESSIHPSQTTFSIIRRQYDADPFEPTHWELFTKYLLPESRDQDAAQHAAMIRSLQEETSVNYEAPFLKNISRSFFLNAVATDEKLCPFKQHGDSFSSSYTRIKEKEITGRRKVASLIAQLLPRSLFLGDFSSSGLYLLSAAKDYKSPLYGIVAVRKLG